MADVLAALIGDCDAQLADLAAAHAHAAQDGALRAARAIHAKALEMRRELEALYAMGHRLIARFAPTACGRQGRLPHAGAPPSRETLPTARGEAPETRSRNSPRYAPERPVPSNTALQIRGVSHGQADSFPLHETQWDTAQKDLQIKWRHNS